MVGIGLCCSPSLLAMSARDQILGFVVTPLPVEDAVVLGGTW